MKHHDQSPARLKEATVADDTAYVRNALPYSVRQGKPKGYPIELVRGQRSMTSPLPGMLHILRNYLYLDSGRDNPIKTHARRGFYRPQCPWLAPWYRLRVGRLRRRPATCSGRPTFSTMLNVRVCCGA